MRRNQAVDRDLLEAALIGYELKRTQIVGRIAEIRARLGATVSEDDAVEPRPTTRRKRRRMSAAARKRIGDATRARWAALRKAKATATKRTSKRRPKLSAAERAKISGGQARWKKNEVPF